MDTILSILTLLYHTSLALSSTILQGPENTGNLVWACGLVGIAGDIDHETRTRVLKDFLDTCASRGRDSTGVIRVKKGSDYTWAKQLGSPAYLYDSRNWDRHIDGEAQAFIGHCRSKTIGDASIRNAHPFDFPDEGICGVHNGTLRMYTRLDTYHHSKVDSEVLYGHLAKNGVEDTFKEVEGAYACVWWNNEEGTLNFIRNDERPLWFTWSADFRTMFWASEIWMFGAVARKKKLWDGDENGQFHQIPPHTFWSFKINPAAKGDEKVLSLKTPKEIKLEKKPYTPTHMLNGGSRQGNGMGARGSFENGRWVERSPGVYERSSEPLVPKISASGRNHGGEVTDPFAESKGKPLVTILDGKALDDELKRQQQGCLDDIESSKLSSIEFLKNSVSPSGSSTEQSSTKNSQRKTLSLPASSSNVYPITNNEGSSETCPGASLNSKNKGQLKSGVSFRIVSGIPYITWNKTGREFTEEEVMKNTGGHCTFCKRTLHDCGEIGDFVTAERVICEDCLSEPQNDALCEAC